ncbi:MAG: GTPase Era [Coriobacteriales bacterium]|jgi:GTP-binding protein Era|nr:GTPase Era [Coriobacteriales bacterium]
MGDKTTRVKTDEAPADEAVTNKVPANKGTTNTAPISTTQTDDFKSGFVTLIGRPNAGKSTLLNAVVKKKLAITSDKPQTTRHRFRAVLDTPGYQLILVDTPGIHKPHDLLGEELNRSATDAIKTVDALCFVLDATQPFGRGDEWILELLQASSVPKILIISKTALADERAIEAQRVAACAENHFDEVISLSALEGIGTDRFIEAAVSFLPQGPRWFPSDMDSDQSLEFIIAEFIREKVLCSTFDEIPHAVGVQVENLTFEKRRGLYRIAAIIFVERDSQKGILIGRHGDKIKHIGTRAREELTHFLGADVYLDLRVKVRKAWRRDLNQVRLLGYGTVE